jgi:TatD DNase family protein
MGYKLGFNGVITFKNSNAFEVIEKLPLNVILLETDSPYLTPEPHRGTKNEPAYIEHVAKRICDIKGISMDELSEITEKNVKDLFDI